MGEVYRARDTKLGRDVAIKVLPEAVAREQERLARFEREGRTLAALNHPNIAIIHGLEDTGGVRALVMELVEGPTLADRIARGPVPPAEALSIARQIVDAFDAAHERGIVHRDLKPANIKITPEGVVKVLDFGLAKAADELLHPDLTQSPTITGVNTRDGVILGTAAYMSPEQARGAVVDKRTDIWAFGCVLYEMLAGAKAPASFGRPGRLGQPEIEQLHDAIISNEDVLGLQIAMDDAAFVSGGDAADDVDGEVDGFADGQDVVG